MKLEGNLDSFLDDCSNTSALPREGNQTLELEGTIGLFLDDHNNANDLPMEALQTMELRAMLLPY